MKNQKNPRPTSVFSHSPKIQKNIQSTHSLTSTQTKMDDSTLEKLQGLKHYNSKLDLWLDSVSSSPIEDLIGVSAKDRSTIESLRSETSALETQLQSLQDLVSSKQQEISALSKKTIMAKFTVPSSLTSSSSSLSQTLQLVLAEEERARKNVVSSGRLPDLKRYLQTQKTLQDKERLLLSQLEQKENLLQKIRDDLARVDLNSVPSRARPRAALYVVRARSARILIISITSHARTLLIEVLEHQLK